MARAMRVCSTPGCPTMTDAGRCRVHEVELAWAAGFFDGEGTITIVSRNSLPRGGRREGDLYVGVNQATRRDDDHDCPPVLERFAAAVGMGVLRGPYFPPGNRRPLFKWYVRNSTTSAQADAVLELLWPYLSRTKRDQADETRARLDRFREERARAVA